MRIYNVLYTTYWKNKQVGFKSGYLVTDDEKENKIYKLTWENANKLWYMVPGAILDKTSKGYKITFFNCLGSIKEWKTKELQLELNIIYADITESITVEKAMKILNTRQAMEFLKQMGK